MIRSSLQSVTQSSTWHARAADTAAIGRSTTAGPMPKVGEVLGKYRLTGILGEGSTCRVYRGEHVRLPLAVAVKVFGPVGWGDPAVLNQVRHEAVLLCGLNHPNIIRLWDFDDDGPYPFLVTELVDGRPLSRMIAEGRTLIPDWAVHLTGQVVDGLEAALQLGIIHRDVKPSNILLTRDGRAKIADLGLAVTVSQSLAARPTASAAADGITGTAGYVAPEQARNIGPVDHRADIYSLGATLYHCVCGRLPFIGRSVMEVIFKHIQEVPRPPASLVPHVPKQLSDLILRMMSKSPADRFASYEDLRQAMTAALENV